MAILLNTLIYLLITVLSTLKRKQNLSLLMFIQLVSYYFFINHGALPDIPYYQQYYETIREFDWNHVVYLNDSPKEKGWYLLNYFIHFISNKFSFLLFIYAVILSWVHTKTINKYSCNILLTYTLYLLSSFISLFVLRQHLAIAVCMLSIPYIVKKRLVPFLVFTLIAFLFHSTAIIWLAIYFIYNGSQTKKSFLVLLTMILIAILSTEFIFNYFHQFIGNKNIYIADLAQQNSWKALIIPFATLLLMVFVHKREILKIEGTPRLFLWMSIISFIISLVDILGTSFSAFYRMTLYFSIGNIYIIPYASKRINNGLTRVIVIIFFIAVYLLAYISTSTSQGGISFIF